MRADGTRPDRDARGCQIDEEHEPHTYPSAVVPSINVRCSGIAVSRFHAMSVIGSIKCSCGWRLGEGVCQWQYAAEQVARHVVDHPEGDFGRPQMGGTP